MGCLYSKKRKEALRKNRTVVSQSKQKYLPAHTDENNANNGDEESNKPEFTDRQKTLVLESWTIIREDLTKVGVQLFMKLFETHPDVQDAFMLFKGLSSEDLSHSRQLRSHALRVMGTVDKCMDCINEQKKIEQILHDLGTRHVMYTAKVDYMDLIGPQFIWAIEPVMGEKWTPELEQAWSDLFKFIAYVMKAAMTF